MYNTKFRIKIIMEYFGRLPHHIRDNTGYNKYSGMLQHFYSEKFNGKTAYIEFRVKTNIIWALDPFGPFYFGNHRI